ncbi:MAG: ABC transporter substrate-binding protein [Cyanobacteria bacterium P01_H01_bin.15]
MPSSSRLFSQRPAFTGLILLGCLLFSLVGCSNLLPRLETQGTESQIVQAILSDPKTFNPVLSAESPNIFSLTFAGLVEQHPITGELLPALAESWNISDDKRTLTFTLRENLRWSDGEPLTIDDVVFSYNDLYLNEAIPTNSRDSLRVGVSKALPQVRKVDERRVEFVIAEPFAPFIEFAGGLSILPEHILGDSVKTQGADGKLKFLAQWGTDTPPQQIIGSGPYQLTSYRTSQRLIFKNNPHYWKAQATGEELPRVEQVVWEIVDSTDTALLRFRSGSLGSIGVTPEYFSLLKREEDRGNFDIFNGGPAYGTSFMFFNLNTGRRNGKPLIAPHKSRWFNNVHFRQAIAHAIDRPRMITNIYRGLGGLQNSPISVQSPFYDGSLPGYDYDPQKARDLLAAEGFVEKNKELFDADGNRVQFSLFTNAGNKVREAMGSQIKQDLSKIGIQVDFVPLAWNALIDKLSNSLEFDSAMLGFTGSNEPHGGANIWFPDGNLHIFNQKPQPGRTPLTDRIVSPWETEIADLFIQASQELDRQRRKEIYAEVQSLISVQVPFIYLVNPYSLSAVRRQIQEIEYSALGGAFWNIEALEIVQQ